MEQDSRIRAMYDELIVDNAMTGEMLRHARKAWRGSNPGAVLANIILSGMLAMVYVYLLIGIIRWDLQMTLGVQIAELFAVTLIAPAAIYAAISGEREKSTWDALVLTRLTPAQIVIGKLAWRVALVVGMMLLLLLMILISQTRGPVHDRPSAMAVLVAQLLILSWGVLLSVFGLWVSARTARSVTSIGVILGALIGALIMLPTLLSIWGAQMDPRRAVTFWDKVALAVTSVNPFLLVGDLGEGRNRVHDLYRSPEWGLVVVVIYLAVAAFLLWRTHATVKRLSGE